MTAGDSINHAFDSGHLSPSFHGVIGVVISPPVPASERIALGKTSPHCHGIGLRIENDNFVRVGPRIISSPLYISPIFPPGPPERLAPGNCLQPWKTTCTRHRAPPAQEAGT